MNFEKSINALKKNEWASLFHNVLRLFCALGLAPKIQSYSNLPEVLKVHMNEI